VYARFTPNHRRADLHVFSGLHTLIGEHFFHLVVTFLSSAVSDRGNISEILA
jgi:hypothetical protein